MNWWLSGGWDGRLSELLCAMLSNTIVHNRMHIDMSTSYRWTVLDFFCVCVFTRVSLFVLGLVILCLVYFLFVSTSAIDCLKRLVSKMTCYVSSRMLNSLTLLNSFTQLWLQSAVLLYDRPTTSLASCSRQTEHCVKRLTAFVQRDNILTTSTGNWRNRNRICRKRPTRWLISRPRLTIKGNLCFALQNRCCYSFVILISVRTVDNIFG